MEQFCDGFLTVVLVVLGILCFFCLVRSVKGPRIADRIVAVNMIGTMTMMGIAVLTVKLKEAFLADVALIYAMISFLAVVVVAKVYMVCTVRRPRQGRIKRRKNNGMVPFSDWCSLHPCGAYGFLYRRVRHLEI